jgi:hypothetical protein
MSLARELKMSVKTMLHCMDSQELTAWQAYFTLEDERLKKEDLKRKSEAGVRDLKAKKKWRR